MMLVINRKVNQCIELFEQSRADGHEAEAGLNGRNNDHTENRSLPLIDFGKYLREESVFSRLLEDLRNRKLPTQSRTGAG